MCYIHPSRPAHSCAPCSPHAALPPFPTRRSSDLPGAERGQRAGGGVAHEAALPENEGALLRRRHLHRRSAARARDRARSEEHTSELQSLTNLVCRLLLEKKNKRQTTNTCMTKQTC